VGYRLARDVAGPQTECAQKRAHQKEASRRNIFEKLCISSRVELAVFAINKLKLPN
jgi:hypothetical protein